MNNNYIKGIIDRIEDQKAVISLDDGQKLIWPLEKLPVDCIEGTIIQIKLNKNDGTDEEDKSVLAKNILNEILNVEN